LLERKELAEHLTQNDVTFPKDVALPHAGTEKPRIETDFALA